MEINQIYTQLIREYSIDIENKKDLDDKTHSQKGVNPSCGDEIKLNLRIKNNIIEDASYEGIGCAISKASTSMMIEIIRGKSIEESKDLIDKFLKMIKNEISNDKELEGLGDAAVLQSISKLPARVKCAVLAWRTLETILDETNQ